MVATVEIAADFITERIYLANEWHTYNYFSRAAFSACQSLFIASCASRESNPDEKPRFGCDHARDDRNADDRSQESITRHESQSTSHRNLLANVHECYFLH
ncbi:PREDICTED: uncharacterized protein LOC105449190 [Wasmannia auropunctata]|uniref:uncharacterized protein LOC105449190 n=1 Tax=Wasmannia auropunctata TaxID=64793 RepID=UPI0005EDB17F|nr:PREDICTED: uncharacterized protein LOC105449190 [Wasmannia auropunctata]